MTNHDMVLYVFGREGFLKKVVTLLTKNKISFSMAKFLVRGELDRLHHFVKKYETA